MVEYRKARPDEWREYVDFANFVFTDDGTPLDFEYEIPKVYAKDVNSADLHCIAHDDTRGIVGLVAVLPNDLTVGDTVLKTGYVGTVSTHPKARGEGHMIALMEMQRRNMVDADTDIAFLGGQRQRYQHYGYVMGGIHHEVYMVRGNIKHGLKDVNADGVVISPILPGSEAEKQAETLFATLPVRFDRSRFGFAIALRTYKKTPYAMHQNGRFLGWLCATESNTVFSEICATDNEALKIMLKAWFTQKEVRSVTFPLHDWQRDTIASVGMYCENMSTCACENIRVFHRKKVVGAYLKMMSARMPLADGRMDFDADGERFSVTVKNNTVTVGEAGDDPIRLTGLEADALFTCPFPYEGRPDTPRGWFPLAISATNPDQF